MFDFCPHFSGPLVAGGALLWAHRPHSPPPLPRRLHCLAISGLMLSRTLSLSASPLMKSQSLRGMFPPTCDGTHLSGVCTSLSQLHLPLTPQHCRNLVINLFFILFSESPPVPMTSATNLLRIFSGQNPATDLFPDTRLTFPALPGIFPSSPMDVSKSTRSN